MSTFKVIHSGEDLQTALRRSAEEHWKEAGSNTSQWALDLKRIAQLMSDAADVIDELEERR